MGLDVSYVCVCIRNYKTLSIFIFVCYIHEKITMSVTMVASVNVRRYLNF